MRPASEVRDPEPSAGVEGGAARLLETGIRRSVARGRLAQRRFLFRFVGGLSGRRRGLGKSFAGGDEQVLRRASDQFGRARVLVPALVALALGNTVLAASPSIGSLIAAAVLLGTGNSMLYPTLVALVVDRTPVSERGLAIGTLSGAWDVGVFVGAPLIIDCHAAVRDS